MACEHVATAHGEASVPAFDDRGCKPSRSWDANDHACGVDCFIASQGHAIWKPFCDAGWIVISARDVFSGKRCGDSRTNPNSRFHGIDERNAEADRAALIPWYGAPWLSASGSGR